MQSDKLFSRRGSKPVAPVYTHSANDILVRFYCAEKGPAPLAAFTYKTRQGARVEHLAAETYRQLFELRGWRYDGNATYKDKREDDLPIESMHLHLPHGQTCIFVPTMHCPSCGAETSWRSASLLQTPSSFMAFHQAATELP